MKVVRTEFAQNQRNVPQEKFEKIVRKLGNVYADIKSEQDANPRKMRLDHVASLSGVNKDGDKIQFYAMSFHSNDGNVAFAPHGNELVILGHIPAEFGVNNRADLQDKNASLLDEMADFLTKYKKSHPIETQEQLELVGAGAGNAAGKNLAEKFAQRGDSNRRR